MRRLTKVLLVSAVMTLLMGVTCFAQEQTKVNPDLTEDQFIAGLASHQATVLAQAQSVENSMADKNAAASHRAMVMAQLKSYNRSEADNYILYRQKRVGGLRETERIKKEVLDNYTALAKVNPGYNNLLLAAQADYNAAVAVRAAEEFAVNKATVDFNALYPR